MKQSGNTVTIATITIALCMLIIVGTLAIIVVRDGHNDLVSQAMGELLWLGGIAIGVLAGLLGFTKFLEAGNAGPASATVSATVQGASPASSSSSNAATSTTDPASLLGSSDVQAMLASILVGRVHSATGDQQSGSSSQSAAA